LPNCKHDCTDIQVVLLTASLPVEVKALLAPKGRYVARSHGGVQKQTTVVSHMTSHVVQNTPAPSHMTSHVVQNTPAAGLSSKDEPWLDCPSLYDSLVDSDEGFCMVPGRESWIYAGMYFIYITSITTQCEHIYVIYITALSIHITALFIYLSLCLSISLSVYLSVCLTLCLSIYLSVYLSVCLFICLFSVYQSFYVCFNVCLSGCVYPPEC